MSDDEKLPPPPPEDEGDYFAPPPPEHDDDPEFVAPKITIAPPPPPATDFDMTEEQAAAEGKQKLANVVWDIAKSSQEEMKLETDDTIVTIKGLYAVAILFYECANQDNPDADMLDVDWAEKDTPAIVDFAKDTSSEVKDTYTIKELKEMIGIKINHLIADSDGAHLVVPEYLQFATDKMKADDMLLNNKVFRETISLWGESRNCIEQKELDIFENAQESDRINMIKLCFLKISSFRRVVCLTL